MIGTLEHGNFETGMGTEMVRRKPEEIRKNALRLWLSGYSYRKIKNQTGLSIATISRIVDEQRKQSLDLDSLRELNLAVKKIGYPLVDVLGSIPFLTKLRELEVSPERLSLYNEVVEKIAVEKGVDPSDFVKASMKVLIWGKEGKSAEEVLRRAERAKAEVSKLEKEIEEANARLEKLKGKLRLTKDLADLKAKIRKAKSEFELYKGRINVLKGRYGEHIRLQQLLSNRVQSFQCPTCGRLTQRPITGLEASHLLQSGRPLMVTCATCGYPASHNIMWILAQIGLQVLT